MGTAADLQAVVDAIRATHSDWQIPDYVQLALSAPVPFAPDNAFTVLRDSAPKGFFDADGQIASPTPGVPPLILPRPNDPSPPPNIPGPPLGTPIDRTLKQPQNHLGQRDPSTPGQFKHCRSVSDDPNYTFIDGYHGIFGATGQGPGNSGWNAMVDSVKDGLQSALVGLTRGMRGQTGTNLVANLNRSFQVLQDLSHHAQTMEELFDTFFDDLATTKANFEASVPAYNHAILNLDKGGKDTLNNLNDLALQIMNVYRGPIRDIAARHPDISSAVPQVGSPMGGTSGANSGTPGGSGGGTPPTLPRSGLNTGAAANPTGPDRGQPDDAGGQSAPGGQGSGQDSGGDSGKGGADGSGKGGDAASKALGDAGKGDPKAATGGPGGLLGLGSKGASGMSKTGTGGGRGGGGGRGAMGAKPAASATPAAKLAGGATPVSRAGLSGAGGQGSGGAPVAGHQGGKADKTHKASKALRLPKNGEELADEADAVAPVIGAAPRRATPPDPKKA